MTKNGWFYNVPLKDSSSGQIKLYHVYYDNGKIKSRFIATKELESKLKGKQVINIDQAIDYSVDEYLSKKADNYAFTGDYIKYLADKYEFDDDFNTVMKNIINKFTKSDRKLEFIPGWGYSVNYKGHDYTIHSKYAMIKLNKF